VLEAVGEQRATRPVHETHRKDFLVRRPALTLHEAARKLARGTATLAVLHLEGEKVDPLPRVGAGYGAQHRRVAVLHEDAAGRQLGQNACFERQGAPADLFFYANLFHLCLSFILADPPLGPTAPAAGKGSAASLKWGSPQMDRLG